MYSRNEDNTQQGNTIFYWNGIIDPRGLSYQEFRIISGCKDLKAYQALGQRQSLHHTAAERQ